MILKFVYIIFIGILLAAFVGVGIAAFYPGPKSPEPPLSIKYCPPKDVVSPEVKQEQEKFDAEEKIFMEKDKIYNRNVSIISLAAAITILIISLTFAKAILVIADGMLLGGVLTLIYSIVRGFASEDAKFRFLVVSIGLVIALFLGYLKFIKSQIEEAGNKKAK
ncbi:MAG: hypothetical protein PHE48_03760 [Candidatus Daviesbacteria bacterium]|nr:hypothetical protein [Candidatus Daviesbacteria bacterium]